jgi:hypothetical protein
MRRARLTQRTETVFGAILFFGLLAMTARPALDPDLWWHLRTGQWIVETGHVPLSDSFSFSRAGHAWVAEEWLSDVVFYELWKHGGAAALIIFSAIVTTLGFMLLYLRCLSPCKGKWHWAAAATVFGALAAAASCGVRPQMFTFTLASLLLWLLESGEDRPSLLLWVPPVFLLWLNLHAGFALGPALLLAYGIGVLVETATGNTPWQEARPLLLRVLLLLLACVAIVPLNPNGAQLYRYPFDTLRSSSIRSSIIEWSPPDFHQALYRPFLMIWLLLLTILASSRVRPNGRALVPLLALSFAALDAVRHVPIFVLVAMPVIAAALPMLSRVSIGRSRRLPISFPPSFSLAVLVMMAAFASAWWTNLARCQNASEAEQFPQAAVTILRAGDYPPRIFVYYDWGGYALWKLYPAYRVFVDGRADLFGGNSGDDDLLRQFRTSIELHNGWRDVLDRWNVEAVLVPPSCALAQALLLDRDWHSVFSDSQAIILLRKHPDSLRY